jgi:hypothetical protein
MQIAVRDGIIATTDSHRNPSHAHVMNDPARRHGADAPPQ